MIVASDVRRKLAALLQNDLSLPEFADWIEANSWNMHSDSRAEAVDLVSSIHSLLSEYDDHVLNDASLRVELSEVLNKVRASITVADSNAVPHKAETVSSYRSTSYWVPPVQVLVLQA